MQRVLDSSPVNLQPVPVVTRRSLKRTASLASLPTPPRTTHKNKRSRKDVSDQEDKFDTSESEHESSPVARVLFEPRRVASKAKADALSEEAAEDAFWLGEDTSKEKKTQQERPRPSSTIGSAPVSPPPSRTNQVGPRFQTPPPLEQRVFSPVSSSGTPLAVPEEEGGPIRDSPNNLFLVESKKAHPVQPVKDTEEDFEEAPTVKYVFRGKGIEMMNPLYYRSPDAEERSKLPPEHPDYSPSRAVKPKQLFAKELAMRSKTRSATKRKRSPSPPSPSPATTRPKRRCSPTKSKSSPARSRPSPRKKRAVVSQES